MSLRTSQISLFLLVGFLFVSCSGGGSSGYNPDIGPFDEDGNYVEAWADNPPKRGSRRSSSRSSRASKAKAKEKAEAEARAKRNEASRARALAKSRERAEAEAKAQAKAEAKRRRAEAWRESRIKREPVIRRQPTPPVIEPRPVVVKPKPRPRPKPKAKPRPRPKPKAKPKAKPRKKPVKIKPKIRRHTVRKGDTLYGLARRYGTSASAIKRANGISGNTIRLGQSLVIPR